MSSSSSSSSSPATCASASFPLFFLDAGNPPALFPLCNPGIAVTSSSNPCHQSAVAKPSARHPALLPLRLLLRLLSILRRRLWPLRRLSALTHSLSLSLSVDPSPLSCALSLSLSGASRSLSASLAPSTGSHEGFATPAIVGRRCVAPSFAVKPPAPSLPLPPPAMKVQELPQHEPPPCPPPSLSSLSSPLSSHDISPSAGPSFSFCFFFVFFHFSLSATALLSRPPSVFVCWRLHISEESVWQFRPARAG